MKHLKLHQAADPHLNSIQDKNEVIFIRIVERIFSAVYYFGLGGLLMSISSIAFKSTGFE